MYLGSFSISTAEEIMSSKLSNKKLKKANKGKIDFASPPKMPLKPPQDFATSVDLLSSEQSKESETLAGQAETDGGSHAQAGRARKLGKK